MTRFEKMLEIAKSIGVTATLKELGGKTYANINGVTFVVKGFASFEARCKELKNYVAPKPINLTSRLVMIEDRTISSLS